MNPADPRYVFHPPGKGRTLLSRFRSFANFVGGATFTVLTAGYARRKAPFAVEFTERMMPMRNLHPAFEGYRIIQFTDLHTGGHTPVDYLKRLVRKINQLPHDMVVVTGDLVTHQPEWIGPACDILARFEKPVIVTFGNHDYADTSQTWTSTAVADALEKSLTTRGITVLRNQSYKIERDGSRVWLVGMEDLWSNRYSVEQAFTGIDRNEPIIALSHSPDTIYSLERAGAQWVLAGHTHGGQIVVPIIGSLMLPIQCKQFDRGEFRVGRARLYVSRGVGCRVPVRFRCSPEVTTFILTREMQPV